VEWIEHPMCSVLAVPNWNVSKFCGQVTDPHEHCPLVSWLWAGSDGHETVQVGIACTVRLLPEELTRRRLPCIMRLVREHM